MHIALSMSSLIVYLSYMNTMMHMDKEMNYIYIQWEQKWHEQEEAAFFFFFCNNSRLDIVTKSGYNDNRIEIMIHDVVTGGKYGNFI